MQIEIAALQAVDCLVEVLINKQRVFGCTSCRYMRHKRARAPVRPCLYRVSRVADESWRLTLP